MRSSINCKKDLGLNFKAAKHSLFLLPTQCNSCPLYVLLVQAQGFEDLCNVSNLSSMHYPLNFQCAPVTFEIPPQTLCNPKTGSRLIFRMQQKPNKPIFGVGLCPVLALALQGSNSTTATSSRSSPISSLYNLLIKVFLCLSYLPHHY